MKKTLFVVIVLALSLSACSAKDAGFSEDYQDACFDMKGLMGPNGCVMQIACTDSSVQNPVSAPASDCKARANELGAPTDLVTAICSATPSGKGVSGRLPVGTEVAIGSITFDNEDRVWFLEGFTTPAMANYAFSYEGSEQSLFDAPFATGTELGYGKDGTRVPFRICWDVTSEGCVPPADLFPTQ